MKLNRIKYLTCLIPHYGVSNAIRVEGWDTWDSLLYLLIIIPLLEIIIGDNKDNLSEARGIIIGKDRWYDYLLYSMVIINYALLFFWLYHLSITELDSISLWGNIVSFGILNGTVSINVAHELGHRNKKYEQILAKALLLSTSYLHFFIEHNRGHHKLVSTEEDPASARYGENLYFFWVRSIIFSYISAWRLEYQRLTKIDKPVVSFENEMIRFTITQLVFTALIFFVFGPIGLYGFIGSSLVGIMLLETVNYIQHYGLTRNFDENKKRYERVAFHHSWDCSYPIGRIMLFELSRHSDHHHKASKKYQILDHKDESPDMPTGYSGMIAMALLPPLWFWVMNPLVKKYTS